MSKAVLVHGWDGSPDTAWFPWLRKQLESRGWSVIVPRLPDSGTPRIKPWTAALSEAVGSPDRDTYFVGHSMGCQTIARYLVSLPEGTEVGGIVYVAGFFKRLTNLEGPESEAVALPWFSTPFDLARVRTIAQKSIALFSDDDPWVPLDNQDDFRNTLGSEIIIEHAKGHWSGERDGCTEVPDVLDALVRLAGT